MVLQAAAPLEQLFTHTGGDDERDQQLLDDLGLKEVRSLKSDGTLSGAGKLPNVFTSRSPIFFSFFCPLLYSEHLGLCVTCVQEVAERLTLFTAEEEIFAFHRTVSRLAEMQTDTYWVEGDRTKKHLDT